MSRTRLIPVLVLSLLSALAVGVPAAQATHPDDTYGYASCVFLPGGVATATFAGEDGVNNAVFDDLLIGGGLDPLQLRDTDPGHFTFSAPLVCAGADTASEGAAPPAGNADEPIVPPTLFTIWGGGDYDNKISGAAINLNGDAVIFDGPAPGVGGAVPPAVGAPPDDAGTDVWTEFGINLTGTVGEVKFVIDADETGGAPVEGQYPTAPSQDQLPWVPAGFYGPAGAHSHAGDNQIDGGEGQGVLVVTPTGTSGPPLFNVTSCTISGSFHAWFSGEGSSDSVPTGPAPAGDSDL